ncbi:hypothetical protein MD484_g6712, partial [Candolleomyces efflorescens]
MEIFFLKDSDTVARYLEWAMKAEAIMSNFRLYWRIGNKGCMALDVLHSVMDLIAASAAEATLLLCLYALLGAKKIWLWAFMILSFVSFRYSTSPLDPAQGAIQAFTVTIVTLEATDISHQRVVPPQALPEHWQGLGYPCYFDSSSQSPVIYGVVGYISFARTALTAFLAIATFLYRYRRPQSSMLKVIRREGGFYYLTTILLRLVDAIVRTPNLPTVIDHADFATLAIAIYSVRVFAIPILANRLLVGMRKIHEVKANTFISTIFFTPTPDSALGSTTDRVSYDFGADPSGPFDPAQQFENLGTVGQRGRVRARPTIISPSRVSRPTTTMSMASTQVELCIHDSVKPFDVPLDALQARHPRKRLVVGVAVLKPARSDDGSRECQVLVVRRVSSEDEFPNAWELPGGGAENDTVKTILDTVVRETFEETGLKVTSITKRIQGFEYSTSKGDAIQFNFLVEVEEPVEVKLNPEEHDDYAWVGLESLGGLFPLGDVSRAVMRDVVVEALKGFTDMGAPIVTE